MPNVLRMLRSYHAGNRPAGKTEGEVYVNIMDGQFGVCTPTPQDLIGLRYFNTTTLWAFDDLMTYNGNIYSAKSAIPPGPYNASQWQKIAGSGQFVAGDLTPQEERIIALEEIVTTMTGLLERMQERLANLEN